jgi:large subunit ribosomal protein L29
MKMSEIREKSDEAIRMEIAEQQKQLFTLRTQAVTEKLEDPSQLRKARRAIAQLMTVRRERELKAQPSKKA